MPLSTRVIVTAAVLALISPLKAEDYPAAFSEALDQPARVFSGVGGWRVGPEVWETEDGVDAVVPRRSVSGSPFTATIATAVTGPGLTGVRFKAWVNKPIPSRGDQPVTLVITGPGGLSRTVLPGSANGTSYGKPQGKAMYQHMVMPEAGVLTWTSQVPSNPDPASTAVVDQLEIFDPALPASVTDALDQPPGQVFVSAAPTPWVRTTAEAFGNDDALISGAVDIHETTDFQTLAPAGRNAVRFHFKTSGDAASTFSVFTNPTEYNPAWQVLGASAWREALVILPSPGNMVRWAYTRRGAENPGAVLVDRVEFLTVTSLQDAIDLAGPVFAAPAGAQPFTRTTAVSLDGTDAAESASGAVPSVMEAAVTGPSVVSWDSRVTAGTPDLEVRVDAGTPWHSFDTTSWAHHNIWVPAGLHTVRFTATDPAAAGNHCLVDQVKVAPWSGPLTNYSNLPLTQTGLAAWEIIPTPAGSRTAGPGFRTGSRTVPFVPDSRVPQLRTFATGPGWLSYRSSVTTAAANSGTLHAPVPALDHGSGTRVAGIAFPNPGPHSLTWEMRGVAAGGALQEATVSDVEWHPGPHPLGYPGPWIIGDDDGWPHHGDLSFNFGHVAGNRTHTISTIVNGPGTLDFQWLAQGAFDPGVSSNGASLKVELDGTAMEEIPAQFITDLAPVSIPLSPGQHTVAWTFHAQAAAPANLNVASFRAVIKNVTVTGPVAAAAAALDTTMPIAATNGWVPETAAGWRDNDRLTVNTGDASLTLSITGPKVFAFRATGLGPWPPGRFTVTGPGGDVIINSAGPGDTLYSQNRALVIPEGQQTITFNATASPSLTWQLDAFESFTPADYSAALNNSLNWSISGNTGYAPVPQITETHDGHSAVAFHYWVSWYPEPDQSSLTTTGVTGPALLTWWQKGGIQLKVDGSSASLVNTANWSRRAFLLPAGPHTLTFAGTSHADIAWLDEVKTGTPFETWLAAFLTPDQRNDPAWFSASSDADGDGRPALLEYALQTSPLTVSPDRAPALTRDPDDPALLHFTWRRSTATPGLTFTPEGSTDLTTWTPIPWEQTGTDGTDTLLRASFRTDTPHRYVRLKVAEL